MTDMVNHPPHYRDHPVFHCECFDIAGQCTFPAGNAVKYMWRSGRKHLTSQDLEKARWYLGRTTDVWHDGKDDFLIGNLISDLIDHANRAGDAEEAILRILDGDLTNAAALVDSLLARAAA